MFVYEFITMFVDEDGQYFELWSNEKEKVIFGGYLSDLPEELYYAEVTSIDNILENVATVLTLNIDEEREEDL